MAGAGFKDFTAGDILTATQVDEYLMQQTVMRFADSAARTTALSGVLAEGMLSYLNDTNTVQVYNGSAWVNVGGGSPLTTKGDVYTYSTTDARLAVGANGTVLTADSAEATGLKWATPSAGGSFTTWTPTWTNLTVGNGTLNSARYSQTGQYVYGYLRFTMGSTSSITGNIKFSLPVTANSSSFQQDYQIIGQTRYRDFGADNYIGFASAKDSGTNAQLYVQNAAGTYVILGDTSGTIPFTWTTSDQIFCYFIYEAA